MKGTPIPINIRDQQAAAETEALVRLGSHIRDLPDATAKKTVVLCNYIVSRVYVLDNGWGAKELEMLDERAEQIVAGWADEREAGKR